MSKIANHFHVRSTDDRGNNRYTRPYFTRSEAAQALARVRSDFSEWCSKDAAIEPCTDDCEE